MEIYSVDGVIKSFFETQVSPNRQQCDDLASSLTKSSVYALSMQGSFSYTLSSKDDKKIVQFRVSNSPLEIETLDLAKEIHGDIIPSTEYYGEIGDGSTLPPLKVYVMEKLPGITHIDMILLCQKDKSVSMNRVKMIRDLASYFASAWLHPQSTTETKLKTESQQSVADRLAILAAGLPSRFHAIISSVRENLHQLYSSSYPQVLTHGDLCEMNILLSESCSISGLVDWAESSIRPFGMELHALDNLLGGMDSQGWKDHEDREVLEKEFWQTFWNKIDIEKTGLEKDELEKLMKLARDAGVLLVYGFVWTTVGIHSRPATEADTNKIRYLNSRLSL